jgi:hypothetical protein
LPRCGYDQLRETGNGRRLICSNGFLIEWPEGEKEPTKYWLSTLPEDTTIDVLVDTAKLRWRIEREYQDLKSELGLAHFEGRSNSVLVIKRLGGGSWGQSGVAFDGGSLFVTTGNGFGSSSSWGGSEAVFRLPPTLSNPTQAADYFARQNWYALDQADLDLGGTSAIPIDVPVSPVVHRVLALGKDGNAYLLNRANLGGVGGQIATARSADR